MALSQSRLFLHRHKNHSEVSPTFWLQIPTYNYIMKVIYLLVLVFLASLFFFDNSFSQDNRQFQDYKQKYTKNYSEGENVYRKFVYIMNKNMIKQHNRQVNKSYTMGINQFGDMTKSEYSEKILGITGDSNPDRNKNLTIKLQQSLEIDREIDWVSLGKVTRVKDQKMCGSCWAFSSIAALQSSYMINKGISSIQFSQQQLVDCSTPYGNHGCKGGQLWFTFKYLQDKGVTTEEKYPYKGKDQNCKKFEAPYKMPNYGWDATCGGLYRALLKGPVTVAVDAHNWQYYKEGIFDDCGNQINHGVLVVGVTKDHWLAKNSYGTSWGISGFIKIKLGNTCSICQYPYFPLL